MSNTNNSDNFIEDINHDVPPIPRNLPEKNLQFIIKAQSLYSGRNRDIMTPIQISWNSRKEIKPHTTQ